MKYAIRSGWVSNSWCIDGGYPTFDTLHFTIHSETVVNPRTGTTYPNSYATDAATGHRIAGTDASTEDDARWMCRHWYAGAKEATEAEVAA